MKIGHTAEKPAPTAPAPASAPTNGSAASAQSAAIPAQADPSAKIELSSSAATLLKGPSAPEFDAEKVARISKSIEDGTFKINPEAIADKLISNAQELLTQVKP
ncbi:MAG TPA: flagellar biosynthesis anti-sigma factor FlgM [Burkholderiaceae bacterium]|nr:flagellar biosynthesis anti-sigma factor FlgM [Burkholderiaceae bacterium]